MKNLIFKIIITVNILLLLGISHGAYAQKSVSNNHPLFHGKYQFKYLLLCVLLYIPY